VKSLSAVIATMFAALLIFGIVPSAFANGLNAALIPVQDVAEGNFIAFNTITMRYPEGSSISEKLDGVNQRLKFTIEGNATTTDNGIANAIAAFNKASLEAGSPMQASSMKLTYTGKISGQATGATISTVVEVVPTFENFVLSGDDESQQGDIVDLEWRGLNVEEPIVVSPPAESVTEGEVAGEIQINTPMGLMEHLYPELAGQIEESAAAEIFDEPILDFERFNQKMDTWHFLFDPSGSLAESSAYFNEASGAKVVSIYSLGESSFREGTFEAEEKDVTATIGGAEVQVHSQVPSPSGQIQIAGYSSLDTSQPDSEFAIVTVETPEGVQSATGSFPVQVLLIFGGMMGAIAVFILWKARK
jgi:hypothetical protein